MHFAGSVNEQYEQYIELARRYLDEFLPVSEQSDRPKSELDNLTPVQFAALHGFDHYLSGLENPSQEVINQQNEYGMRPLHLAAIHGHVHTIEALLSQGANPNLTNNVGQLPIATTLIVPILHEPDLLEKKNKIFELLKARAPGSILHQDDIGDTVIHLMAAHRFNNLLDLTLAENQELAAVRNNFSNYPIHTAILNANLEGAKILFTIKGTATFQGNVNRVPLHYAARYGSKAMVDLCCEQTPDINIRDGEDKTALILAMEAQNIAALDALIMHHANPSLCDYEGQSILHHAVLTEDENLVRWVLKHTSVDLNQKDTNGKTALDLANEQGLIEIQKILLDRIK